MSAIIASSLLAETKKKKKQAMKKVCIREEVMIYRHISEEDAAFATRGTCPGFFRLHTG